MSHMKHQPLDAAQSTTMVLSNKENCGFTHPQFKLMLKNSKSVGMMRERRKVLKERGIGGRIKIPLGERARPSRRPPSRRPLAPSPGCSSASPSPS